MIIIKILIIQIIVYLMNRLIHLRIINNKYVLTNSMRKQHIIDQYSKKLVHPEGLKEYSSDIAEMMNNEKLKEIIKSSGMLQ